MMMQVERVARILREHVGKDQDNPNAPPPAEAQLAVECIYLTGQPPPGFFLGAPFQHQHPLAPAATFRCRCEAGQLQATDA